MKLDAEEFQEWVKQGLKVSHGMNLDIIPDEKLPSLLPRAPVAYAFVTDSAAVNSAVNVEMPAMIPLPMNKFSVKARIFIGANCLHVYYKAIWYVPFVKPTHLCDIFLAVPGPVASQMGILDVFRIQIPNCSKPDIKPFSTHEPAFDDVFFIERPQVDGGAEVHAYFHFTVPLPCGDVFFSIPLGFPFYSKGFCDEWKQQVISGPPRWKIRVYLRAEEGQVIRDYSLNYPLQLVMQHEDLFSFLQESEGPNMEWPGGILTCSFSCKDKKATRCDRPTSEMLKPLEKKPRLRTEAF